MIIFLHHFSHPVCIVISLFLLTNDVKMITFRGLLISCSQEKHQRQKSDNASANIPAALILCVRRCVAMSLCMQKSFSFNQAESRHHVTWCLVKTRIPDIKVRCGRYKWSLQQDGVPSHTARNTETCSVKTCSSVSQTCCPPNTNSPDLNTVNLPSGVLFSRRSTIIKVSPRLTKWR